ncbi:MAG: dihydropteroate synthase [Exilibacterium sp.]
MGILNTTPDSFSDGGNCYRGNSLSLDMALRRAEEMVRLGADIIDIGGESTRPGAEPVSEARELQRVVPVVEIINRELDVVVSVDTSTPAVIRDAAAAGAGLINDVRALRREGALKAAAETKLPICLMHMQGEPDSMQCNPHYGEDVVEDVMVFLRERIGECEAAGIDRGRLLVDPGFGFGKTVANNLTLLRDLERLQDMGLPILVGLSRKSMMGALLGRNVDERLPGSLALMLMAVQRGAKIVRVHDVAATQDVLKIYRVVERANTY